jgi:hypothetical protein
MERNKARSIHFVHVPVINSYINQITFKWKTESGTDRNELANVNVKKFQEEMCCNKGLAINYTFLFFRNQSSPPSRVVSTPPPHRD